MSDFMSILISSIPVAFMLIVIFSQSYNLERENGKRSAQGKPALTAEEYQRQIKNARIIACVILAIAWIISQLIIVFA